MRNVIVCLLFILLFVGCKTTEKTEVKIEENSPYQEVTLPDGQKVLATNIVYYGRGVLKSVVIPKEEKVTVTFPDKNKAGIDYISYYDNGNIKEAFINRDSKSKIEIHTMQKLDNVIEVAYHFNGALKKLIASNEGFSLTLPDGQNSKIYAISYYEDTKIESIFPLANQKTVMPNGEWLLSSEVRFNENGNIDRAWLFRGEKVTMPNGEKVAGEIVFYNDNGTIREVVTPITEINLPDKQRAMVSLIRFDENNLVHILLANNSNIATPDGATISDATLVDYHENGKMKSVFLDGKSGVEISKNGEKIVANYYLEYDSDGKLVEAN